MRPEKKPSPSPLGYIPVETTDDADSTTKKSSMEVPSTTITVDAAPASFATQRPSRPMPPPQRISKEGQQVLAGMLCLLLFVGTCVTIYYAMDVLMKLPFQREGPEIYVNNVAFSLNILSPSQINTAGEITFNITKPRDCSVSRYDNFEVGIFYEEKSISMTIMEPFTQMEMNHTLRNAIFPSVISPIETQVSKRITSYFTSNSSFEFSFNVKAIVFMWPDNWAGPGEFSSERWIRVWCPNVKVEIVTKTGLGTMVGEPLKCEVKTRDLP
ncbi:hypothetical protein Vadar_021621 [Vaccinium darrowii]|uniref:Uncharacterized protein n=1 Tax=Vaccinium darrowii TaxID=229202 RepID=A0ACB7Y0N8_9ERIC|nr:hypothetical protein Vadar_021621 [Vaccinium darrowii]